MFDLRPLRAALLLMFLAAARMLCAQEPVSTTLQEHVDRLPKLRTLVERCTGDPHGCTPGAVGPDERFTLPNGTATQVHYSWLRLTLKAMSTAKPEDRHAWGESALSRLSRDPAPASPAVDTGRATRTAAEVLSQVEFAKSKPNWFAEQWDRFVDWLDRHLNLPTPTHGTNRWLRFLGEAVLFGTPLLLLILWLLRQAREVRLRPESTAKDPVSSKRKGDPSWLDLAQECARRGEWREAVHALYWQTVATLEGRRLLSVSRSRTPRETLRLLDAASPARRLLREQTALLESVWYGQHPATEQDYQRARSLQEELLHV